MEFGCKKMENYKPAIPYGEYHCRKTTPSVAQIPQKGGHRDNAHH